MAAEHVALIGARIKQAREEAHLTQNELADLLPGKADGNQVSKWERGAHRPGDDTLEHLAKALKRPVAWFMTREPDKTRVPDPFHLPTMTREQVDDMVQENRARLERIENRLNEVWDHLALMEAALNTLAGEVLKAGQRSTEPASSTGRPARRRRAA